MPDAAAARTGRVALRAAFVVAVALSLVTGIAGGLLRAGVVLPAAGAGLGRAAADHAFLMVCGFLGTVIGIERAVALKRRLAFAAPVASALAGIMAFAGIDAARWLAVAAATAFVTVNVLVVMRQHAAHTALLLAGAGAWLVGNALHALGARPDAVVPWWFAFLILTIAAERLEMTRMMRRRPGASLALHLLLGAALLGAAASAVTPLVGGVLYGAALTGLAVWLLGFDIARRTIAVRGLSRYMAVCLLLGYAWLAVAGGAWIAVSLGHPGARDAALHALALGFVFSMMLAHAPVILPAVAGIKLRFGSWFYAPLLLLHGSLLVRLVDTGGRGAGAAWNAVAIVLFAATVAGSAIAWRVKYASAPRRPPR